jgi:hypothetical protein
MNEQMQVFCNVEKLDFGDDWTIWMQPRLLLAT